MNGAELIAKERQRQIEVKGYTPDHDDAHINEELAQAGSFYAMTEDSVSYIEDQIGNDMHLTLWPFGLSSLKVDPDRINNLVKAGALIAAEIDRLKRLNNK